MYSCTAGEWRQRLRGCVRAGGGHFEHTQVLATAQPVIMKAHNGLLMTQKEMTLKDECGYIMSENFTGHVCQTLS